MHAALETLVQAARKGRKLAALGDMFELGEHAKREHYRLGLAAARCDLDCLFLLGEWAKEVRRGALKGGLPVDRVVLASSHDEIARSIRRIAKKGDWFLVKGSRGMKMERILLSLRQPPGRA